MISIEMRVRLTAGPSEYHVHHGAARIHQLASMRLLRNGNGIWVEQGGLPADGLTPGARLAIAAGYGPRCCEIVVREAPNDPCIGGASRRTLHAFASTPSRRPEGRAASASSLPTDRRPAIATTASICATDISPATARASTRWQLCDSTTGSGQAYRGSGCQRSRIAGSRGMTSWIYACPPPPSCLTAGTTTWPRENRIMDDKTADNSAAPMAPSNALLCGPRSLGGYYDQSGNRMIVQLQTDAKIGLAPQNGRRPGTASGPDLEAVGLAGFGLGRHCPAIDADLYVPSLLRGVLGSHRSMAACLGGRGSCARGLARTAAPREKGRCAGQAGPVGA
jgi:hypothetical protein